MKSRDDVLKELNFKRQMEIANKVMKRNRNVLRELANHRGVIDSLSAQQRRDIADMDTPPREVG